MRALLVLPVLAALASCSLFGDNVRTTDYTVILTTVIDSVGKPDSAVAWFDLNSEPGDVVTFGDTITFGASDLKGTTLKIPLESRKGDSIHLRYWIMRAGRAIAGNDTLLMQGDDIKVEPLLAPSITAFAQGSKSVEVDGDYYPNLKVHNSTNQAVSISVDWEGDGEWDITNPYIDYIRTRYSEAGTYTLIARVFDYAGLEGLDTMLVVVTPKGL